MEHDHRQFSKESWLRVVWSPLYEVDIGPHVDGIGDRACLDILDKHLPQILGPAPDLVIYLAGADPFREDLLGGLGLSKAGLRERDRLVFEECRAAGARVAVTLAGGYACDTDDTVAIHGVTVEEALGDFRARGDQPCTDRASPI